MAYPQTVQRCHEVIARLEEKIEALQADLEYAGTIEDEDGKWVAKYRLTARELELFLVLKSAPMVGFEEAVRVFGCKDRGNLRAYVRFLRNKLKPYGVQITTHRHLGYSMTGYETKGN
jgi:hypothetical protein